MDFATELDDVINRALAAGVSRSDIESELALKAMAFTEEAAAIAEEAGDDD